VLNFEYNSTFIQRFGSKEEKPSVPPSFWNIRGTGMEGSGP